MFLDPKFFDSDDKLFPAVRSRMLDVANEVLNGLKEKITFTPAFIILTGSLASLNFDKFSDIDLHIGINFQEFPEEEVTLVKSMLAYYARNFNNQNYKLKGRKIEIYFQDSNEKHEANGIYDLVHDFWIKIPDQTPKVFNSKVKKAADEFLRNIDILIFEWDNMNRTHEEIPKFIDKVNGFMKQITEMRKQSLLHDGLFGFGNQVFRELRRNGTLPKLSDLRGKAQEAWYEVGEGKMSVARNIIRELKLLEQIDSLGPYFDANKNLFSPSNWHKIEEVMGRNVGISSIQLKGNEVNGSVSKTVLNSLIRPNDPGNAIGEETFFFYFTGKFEGHPYIIGGFGSPMEKAPNFLFVRKNDQSWWLEKFPGELK